MQIAFQMEFGCINLRVEIMLCDEIFCKLRNSFLFLNVNCGMSRDIEVHSQ